MSESVGTLVIDLEARIARLETETKRATTIVEKMSKDMDTAVSFAKNALGTLGLSIGAVSVAKLVRDQIELGDQLSKTSQKVGVSVENLSVYQYAAKLSGVENEQLSVGLAKLSKQMQDAAINKTSEAAVQFKALGIQTTDTTGRLRDTNLVFEDIARKFANAPDGPEKTAAAIKLLGRSGAELIPLLNSLDTLSSEARNSGRVVSTEFAKASEAFNDQITRMTDSASMFFARSESGGAILNGLINALKGIEFVAIGVSQGFEELGTSIGAYAAASAAAVKGNFGEARTIVKMLDEDIAAVQKRGEEARANLFNTENNPAKQAPPTERIALPETDTAKKYADDEKKYQDHLRKNIEALQASVLTEQELEDDKYAKAQMDAFDAWETKILKDQGYMTLTEQLSTKHQQNLTEINKKEAEKRVSVERQAAQQSFSAQVAVWQQVSSLIQTIGGKKKGAALAALVIDKGIGIAQTFINTQVASMRALAELGPIAGAAAAARIQTMGAISIGLIAAQGLAQASQLGKTPDVGGSLGGGGGGISDAANGSAPLPESAPGLQANIPTRNINLTLVGSVFSAQTVRDELVPLLNEAQRDGMGLNITTSYT